MDIQTLTNQKEESNPLVFIFKVLDPEMKATQGFYVGYSLGGANPVVDRYTYQVNRLRKGLPSRHRTGYRLVHQALAKAVEQSHPIVLEYLQNASKDDLKQVRKAWIEHYTNILPLAQCYNVNLP